MGDTGSIRGRVGEGREKWSIPGRKEVDVTFLDIRIRDLDHGTYKDRTKM